MSPLMGMAPKPSAVTSLKQKQPFRFSFTAGRNHCHCITEKRHPPNAQKHPFLDGKLFQQNSIICRDLKQLSGKSFRDVPSFSVNVKPCTLRPVFSNPQNLEFTDLFHLPAVGCASETFFIAEIRPPLRFGIYHLIQNIAYYLNFL